MQGVMRALNWIAGRLRPAARREPRAQVLPRLHRALPRHSSIFARDIFTDARRRGRAKDAQAVARVVTSAPATLAVRTHATEGSWTGTLQPSNVEIHVLGHMVQCLILHKFSGDSTVTLPEGASG